MRKSQWLSLGLLSLGIAGIFVTRSLTGSEEAIVPPNTPRSEYTLDGTLEPGETDGMSPMRRATAKQPEAETPDNEIMTADAPVKMPVPFKNGNGETQFAADDAIPLVLPQRFRADGTIMDTEIDRRVAQVQYRSPAQQQKNDGKPQLVETPSLQSFAGMSDAEQSEALKKALQKILRANMRRNITTQQNDPGDILLMALPFGADSRVYQPNAATDARDKNAPKGSYIYSIGTLCWNYPCAGKTLLRTDGQRVYARIGAGYQTRPASFLALLAMSNIMPNYEIKVSGGVYNIGHLIASEKASIAKGMNLSMELTALSFYGESGDQWKNEMGETWNIEKMVTSELNRSIDQGGSDVTDWLLGLTAAVKLFEEEGKTLRGPLALAKKQLGTYHEFVLSVQNENYLWHPKFFLFKGVGGNNFDTLYASGHILRWLMYSLSDSQVKDAKVKRAVSGLISAAGRVPTNTGAGTMTPNQIEGLAVSLHALSLYGQRVYGETLLQEQPAEKKPDTKPATQPEKNAKTKSETLALSR